MSASHQIVIIDRPRACDGHATPRLNKALWKGLSVSDLHPEKLSDYEPQSQKTQSAFQNKRSIDLLMPSTGFQQETGTASGQGIIYFPRDTSAMATTEAQNAALQENSSDFLLRFYPMKQEPPGLSEHTQGSYF